MSPMQAASRHKATTGAKGPFHRSLGIARRGTVKIGAFGPCHSFSALRAFTFSWRPDSASAAAFVSKQRLLTICLPITARHLPPISHALGFMPAFLYDHSAFEI